MTDDIRIFRSKTNEAVVRLAQLDSQPAPSGPVLAAEIGGELRAALPLDGGPPLADPFHRTAELVSLLELRLAQECGKGGRSRARQRLRFSQRAPKSRAREPRFAA